LRVSAGLSPDFPHGRLPERNKRPVRAVVRGSVTVPVDLWYGAEDTAHSPDNGARLATRVPGARRHVVPGIGGALLWTHAAPILSALLAELPNAR
jgi:pimeloyl-ACP methyl ester carboxylesterase